MANATNNPGPGKQTYYYTNQQSARLLFYHDHAWGITRLNVYAGEAAGYLIKDPVEEAAINGGTVNGQTVSGAGTISDYRYGIPLIIQDKTFVNASIGTNGTDSIYTMTTDPTWAWGSVPGTAHNSAHQQQATSGGPMFICLPRTPLTLT